MVDVSATVEWLFSARARGTLAKSLERWTLPPDLQQGRLLKDVSDDLRSERARHDISVGLDRDRVDAADALLVRGREADLRRKDRVAIESEVYLEPRPCGFQPHVRLFDCAKGAQPVRTRHVQFQ